MAKEIAATKNEAAMAKTPLKRLGFDAIDFNSTGFDSIRSVKA
jgi:hypothetical protein